MPRTTPMASPAMIGERCTSRGIAVLVSRATPMPTRIKPSTITMGPSAVILSWPPIWNALREMLMKPVDAVIHARSEPTATSTPLTTTVQHNTTRGLSSKIGTALTGGLGVRRGGGGLGNVGDVVTGGGAGKSVHAVPSK